MSSKRLSREAIAEFKASEPVTGFEMPLRNDELCFLIAPHKEDAVFCDAETGTVYVGTGRRLKAEGIPDDAVAVYGPFVAGKLIVFGDYGERLDPRKKVLESWLYSQLSEVEKQNVNLAYRDHYGVPITDPLPKTPCEINLMKFLEIPAWFTPDSTPRHQR